MQQIISANRLRDGIVVYLGPRGEWVTDIALALVFETDDALAAGKAEAQHEVAANFVIDPVIVDIAECQAGHRDAVTLRNKIRALGPTVNFGVSSSAYHEKPAAAFAHPALAARR